MSPMFPTDAQYNTLKCCICRTLTSRVIRGKPVCTSHFVQGFGRLPNMPLPGEETKPEVKPEESAPLYVSEKSKGRKVK